MRNVNYFKIVLVALFFLTSLIAYSNPEEEINSAIAEYKAALKNSLETERSYRANWRDRKSIPYNNTHNPDNEYHGSAYDGSESRTSGSTGTHEIIKGREYDALEEYDRQLSVLAKVRKTLTSLLIRKFLEKGTPSINTKAEVTRCAEGIILDAALQAESEKDIVLRSEIEVGLDKYTGSECEKYLNSSASGEWG
ncbi:MAG: hypothetical protein HY072_03495 [Deltaproteobacteria bacterium]|nr:hypothetical protein [Deltaproteobacteria bacterium]